MDKNKWKKEEKYRQKIDRQEERHMGEGREGERDTEIYRERQRDR